MQFFRALRPPLSFVFDIDGVLLRGPNVIPAAKRALSILDGDNPFGKKIPYIFLTNGGGVAEEDRCRKLSQQLGVKVEIGQYCQAHTVLKMFVNQYSETPVLVLGGHLDTVRRVAKGYGFKKAYTTLDVLAWNPAVWPFHTLTEAEKRVAQPTDFSQTPISAIFVYHDPRNWALDIQVTCDAILSGGCIGGPYQPIEQQKAPVRLIFCNPDLLWKSDYVRPRLGQGAFKTAFQAVFKGLAGSEYPHTQYGKPTKATYDFAELLLHERVKQIYGDVPPPQNVYMIGDNPESDIAGANSAGWSSILVKTGVYDPSDGPPSHLPTHVAEDVEEAVRWAIQREVGPTQLSHSK